MNMHIFLAAETNQPTRESWEEALANRDTAKRAYDNHFSTVWEPLSQELDRISPRPDLCFEIEEMNGRVTRYLVPANDLHSWDEHWSPLFRRKATAIRTAWLAHRIDCERLGWDAACAESERLCDIQCSLESHLILMPSPDAAALMWKLEHLFGPETRKLQDYCDSWCGDWINAVMDDARRILGQGDLTLFACAAQISNGA